MKSLEKNDAFDNASAADGDGFASNLVDELKKVQKQIYGCKLLTMSLEKAQDLLYSSISRVRCLHSKQIATVVGMESQPSDRSELMVWQYTILLV